MSKKRHGDRLPPFVALTWEMLNSKAFKDLPASAAKALPYFLGKYKYLYHDPQRSLFEFTFSYSEGKRYGFASSTFSNVIKDLVSRGFIDPVDKGGLRSDGKSHNLFKLSRRWEKYGTPEFQKLDWKCFLPKPHLRATSKSEMNSSRNGNENVSKGKSVSHFEAVEALST